jgi:hypothetical protein
MFSRLQPFATYENEYFRLNENTIKNGNSTKFANCLRGVLGAGYMFSNKFKSVFSSGLWSNIFCENRNLYSAIFICGIFLKRD